MIRQENCICSLTSPMAAGFKFHQMILFGIRSIHRFTGDPEPLRHNWTRYWSRRIDREYRIIYGATDDAIIIAQCRYHY